MSYKKHEVSHRASPRWLILVAIVAIGLNLRPFLTAVGPLAATIRAGTGLDYEGMAWLTLLPMLLMGVARLQRRGVGCRRAAVPVHGELLLGIRSA